MILRFKHILCNTVFPNRFERMDKDGSIEMIRLVQGTNEVVESKQDKKARSKDFRTGFANIRENGEVFYQTEISDQAILNYLKKTPYWGTYIFEHDPIAVSKKESETAKAEISVLSRISTISDNTELLSIGYALFGKDALVLGKQDNHEGLRVKIFQEAMNDSNKVKELLDSDNKSDYMLVALAFAKEIVIEADAGNSVAWGDQNGAKILSVSLGERPIDSLISFFSTVEGREVRQLIGMKLEGKTKKVAGAKAKATTTETTEATE